MRNRRADGERVNLFDMRLTYTLLLQYDKLNALFAHRLGENATRFLSSCGIYRTRGSQCHRDPHPSLSHRRNKGKREIKSHTHWQQLENLFTITLTTGNENSIRLVRLAFIKPANDRKFYRYLFIIKFAYYYDLFVPFSLSLRVTPVETERTQWQAASTKRRVICSIRFVFFSSCSDSSFIVRSLECSRHKAIVVWWAPTTYISIECFWFSYSINFLNWTKLNISFDSLSFFFFRIIVAPNQYHIVTRYRSQ